MIEQEIFEPPVEQWEQDLRWVHKSPSLISSNSGMSLYDLTWPADRELDRELLQQCITSSASYRVGDYFETLVAFVLEQGQHVEMLVRGEQVFEDKKTVGEVDFVFRDQRDRIVHLETAVKFFLLSDSDETSAERWIGPDPSDNLAQKLHRMSQHQLPLGKRLDLSIDHHCALVKGRAFLPWPHRHDRNGLSSHAEISATKELSEDCSQGSWLRMSQRAELARSFAKNFFAVMQKPYWLTTPCFHDAGHDRSNSCKRGVSENSVDWSSPSNRGLPMSCEQFITLLDRTERGNVDWPYWGLPLLFSIMEENETGLSEIERCFIVDDDWPQSKK